MWAAAAVIYPGLSPKQLYRRLRFLARAAARWSTVHHVLKHGTALQKNSLEARPQAIGLIEWPYIHSEWAVDKRLAAFKQHCTFGFWKGSLFLPKEKDAGENAMGQFGRIASVDDLPPKKVLLSYIKRAAKLNEEGVKAPKAPKINFGQINLAFCGIHKEHP